MKYTFVGDVHGKVDAVEAALAAAGMAVFVGDFMDSFDRRPSDHRKCIELVLAAIKAGKARAIYGNHELSYIMPEHRCSGWCREHQMIMHEFAAEIQKHFEPFILLAPKVLVTHAGLTRQLWDEHRLTLAKLEPKLRRWWEDPGSPMHGVGYCRGGMQKVGGIFWCDFNKEFKPVPGLTQVFGHTASGSGGEIRRVNTSYCIDCLDKAQKFLTLEIA